jgi:uncharacterized coiled-coil DUF342 family protein
MISNEALAERKWGAFPELRKLFERYPVPPGVYGYSSVSDNMAAQIGRLIEVAATIKANADKLSEESLQVAEPSALLGDLDRLHGSIRNASKAIEDLNNSLKPMAAVAHRLREADEMEKYRAYEAAQKQANGDTV